MGVKKGGVVSLVRHEVELTCQAMNVPTSIEIDIAKMNVGDNVHIRDLNLPKGAVATDHEDITVLSIVAPKAGIVEDTEAAEGEVAEGEDKKD